MVSNFSLNMVVWVKIFFKLLIGICLRSPLYNNLVGFINHFIMYSYQLRSCEMEINVNEMSESNKSYTSTYRYRLIEGLYSISCIRNE